MRCHYDVLGIELTATSDEIKKAYRKCALRWHPDKHSDSDKKAQEEANRRFLEISDAYETLIDANDRAWYDSHREVLINGGNPGEPGEANYMFNIFPFFSPTCFKGYGDDEKGFYSVYRDMFTTLSEEDKQFYEEGVIVPDFGNSTSSYDEVVAPFYSFWLGYCTPRSFVWCEKHDTREAGDRHVRRIMEKENKKLIDKAKKERNEEIRKLVETVRKRDQRVVEYKKQLEEKSLAAQKKAQEKRDADRLKKLEEMKTYVEPEWSSVGKKLQKLHMSEESGDEEDYDSEDDFDESLFCVACDKSFKNAKSMKNHENSKKHKENIELLREHMLNDDEQMSAEKNSDQSIERDEEDAADDDGVAEEEAEEDKPEHQQKLSKKDKKKRKNKQVLLQNLEIDDSDVNEELEKSREIPEGTSGEKINEAQDTEMETAPACTSKKGKKDKKTKKTATDGDVIVLDEDDEQNLKCTVCLEEFETRNKLFDHIKSEGHASVSTLSYNQIKKQRILLAKMKKAKK